MEQKRRRLVNNIEQQIKTIKFTIQNLKSKKQLFNPSEKSNCDSIEKIELKIKEKLDIIENYKEKIKKIKKGELDNEIEKEYRKNRDIQNDKLKETKEKREQKKIDNENKNERLRNYNRMVYKNSQRDIDRSYRWFQKTCNRFPANLDKKLDNMPNNMGYIWKGIHFYGKLPEEDPNTLIMFEKKDNFLYTYTRKRMPNGSIVRNVRQKKLYDKK